MKKRNAGPGRPAQSMKQGDTATTRPTISPSAAPDQAPSDETITKQQHTRKVFAFLDRVVADRELSAPAFKVAYVIAQHINRETGEAWCSTDTIAKRGGVAQSTVRKAVLELHERAHLDVTWGRQGRGNPNKYSWPRKERTGAIMEPKKERTAAVLDEDAKERFQQRKERNHDLKERGSAMNHFNNNLKNNQERGYAARSARVERDDAVDLTKDQQRAFGALDQVVPREQLHHRCRATFKKLLDQGNDLDVLIDDICDQSPHQDLNGWLTSKLQVQP
jgi:hypothetical protein